MVSLPVLLRAELLDYEFYDSVRCVSFATRCKRINKVFVFGSVDQKYGNEPNARKKKKKKKNRRSNPQKYILCQNQ